VTSPAPEPDIAALQRDFEQALLGGERKFTRVEVSERAGISIERAERMWHALGFATVPDDEIAFTDGDVEALRLVAALEDDGFIDPAVESSLARKLGQTR
jgi:adenylate cyclase